MDECIHLVHVLEHITFLIILYVYFQKFSTRIAETNSTYSKTYTEYLSWRTEPMLKAEVHIQILLTFIAETIRQEMNVNI